MTARPALTVVVTLVSGRAADLERCLAALAAQAPAVPTEVVVPYDDPCAGVTALAARFPSVRFLRAEGLDTARARRGASREHHDALRTIGLRAARGDVVALTEDHAHAEPGWAAALLAALEADPRAAAVGGAVECDADRAVPWAVWFCDFGRYQNPLPDGPSRFVSDSNVAYRREALESVAAAWAGDYHETPVHGALVAAGRVLRTTPRAVVRQRRGELGLREALRERYVWGKSFAGTRARVEGAARRAAYAVLSPLLPAVMTARLARTTFSRGSHAGRFVRLLPLVLLLQASWAAGEFAGYVTGRP